MSLGDSSQTTLYSISTVKIHARLFDLLADIYSVGAFWKKLHSPCVHSLYTSVAQPSQMLMSNIHPLCQVRANCCQGPAPPPLPPHHVQMAGHRREAANMTQHSRAKTTHSMYIHGTWDYLFHWQKMDTLTNPPFVTNISRKYAALKSKAERRGKVRTLRIDNTAESQTHSELHLHQRHGNSATTQRGAQEEKTRVKEQMWILVLTKTLYFNVL